MVDEGNMNEALLVNIARHTKNHHPMVEFYRDQLGMQVKQSWDQLPPVYSPGGSFL
jgi:hypothetical protein